MHMHFTGEQFEERGCGKAWLGRNGMEYLAISLPRKKEFSCLFFIRILGHFISDRMVFVVVQLWLIGTTIYLF